MMSKNNLYPDYNTSRPLGEPKYRVNYNVNNDKVTLDYTINDEKVYKKGSAVYIEGYGENDIYFSDDGQYAYKFLGWSFGQNTNEIDLSRGDELIIANYDVNLYAVWSKEFTLIVNEEGVMSFNTLKFGNKHIPLLIIPEYTPTNVRIKTIDTASFIMESYITTILVPPNIELIKQNAFSDWLGKEIRFIDNPITVKYQGLYLEAGAFNNTPNLIDIVLPYRWVGAEGQLTNAISNKHNKFYIRNTKEKMEEQINPPGNIEAYLAPDDSSEYTRKFYWGYND